jgi:hypothetical protein
VRKGKRIGRRGEEEARGIAGCVWKLLERNGLSINL